MQNELPVYKETNGYKGAIEVLRALIDAGFESYIVGGAVRDIAMKVIPHDYDIATAARPEQIEAVVADHGWGVTSLVGKVFGVLIVKHPLGCYEIATFRSEQYGAHSHRPESVQYADTFKEDVLRRDFTMNGMGLSVDGYIVDYENGLRDIKKKQIDTIGYADERFREDALRMFRACRFAGQLGFVVSDQVVKGIRSNFQRVEGLSLERVRQEVERLLISPYVAKGLDILIRTGLGNQACQRKWKGQIELVPILPELFHLVDLPQEKAFHEYDGWVHTLAVVQDVKSELLLRWAALLHDVGKGMPGIRGIHKGRLSDHGHDLEGAEIARKLLERWGYPKDFVTSVVWLVEKHMRFHYFRNFPEANINKWIRKEVNSGVFRKSKDLADAFRQLGEVGAADVVGSGKEILNRQEIVEFGECMGEAALEVPIHSSDLKYDKEVMIQLGNDAKHIMPVILKQVQDGLTANEPTAIREAIERRLDRIGKLQKGDK